MPVLALYVRLMVEGAPAMQALPGCCLLALETQRQMAPSPRPRLWPHVMPEVAGRARHRLPPPGASPGAAAPAVSPSGSSPPLVACVGSCPLGANPQEVPPWTNSHPYNFKLIF